MLWGTLIEPTHEFAEFSVDDSTLGVRMEGLRAVLDCATYTRLNLPEGLGLWVNADEAADGPVNQEATALAQRATGQAAPVIRGNAVVFGRDDYGAPVTLTDDQRATVVLWWRVATIHGSDPARLRPRMALR
ncbi:hypothetical protein ACPPVW_18455 [Leifsonia sp. McL0607]|uniref:hypothetical protein n=1 Tax=Leifsonia sp. McL0607 TaxID=3415672 RepID=UPI003CE84FD0